jgi:nickel-type superoxide dismutase maturation protease
MTVRNAVGEFWLWARGRRRRLRVEGESMVPTVQPGQYVLYEPDATPAVGDVVVARHPSQSIDIVKRVGAIDSVGLVELTSDNGSVGTDSRTFGRIEVGDVLGRVTISLEWPFAEVGRR